MCGDGSKLHVFVWAQSEEKKISSRVIIQTRLDPSADEMSFCLSPVTWDHTLVSAALNRTRLLEGGGCNFPLLSLEVGGGLCSLIQGDRCQAWLTLALFKEFAELVCWPLHMCSIRALQGSGMQTCREQMIFSLSRTLWALVFAGRGWNIHHTKQKSLWQASFQPHPAFLFLVNSGSFQTNLASSNLWRRKRIEQLKSPPSRKPGSIMSPRTAAGKKGIPLSGTLNLRKKWNASHSFLLPCWRVNRPRVIDRSESRLRPQTSCSDGWVSN